MRSIKEIFVIGYGPSSSHTMGPAKACDYILENYKEISHINVTLYGSLALTGKGHLTDYIIDLKFKNVPHSIVFDTKTKTNHPNTMEFVITNKDGTFKEKIISIGGGTILTRKNFNDMSDEIYPHKTLEEILKYCDDKNISLHEYVESFENNNLHDYLKNCLDQINASIKNGSSAEGYLPGTLRVKRKAKEMFANSISHDPEEIMAASAFAVAEENASGGKIVIAPTCGSAGVFGGVISYLNCKNVDEEIIIKSLMVAGLIGIITKTNACISGAEAGCQAEIGVACAMGAAAIANAKGLNNYQIARAAEIALEHSLGLTCDPVQG